jgi:hypothetical protein
MQQNLVSGITKLADSQLLLFKKHRSLPEVVPDGGFLDTRWYLDTGWHRPDNILLV